MKILRLTHESKEFYKYMGPVFGSRKIQRETGDRFYDDEGKIWFVAIVKGYVAAAISVKNRTIKNMYGSDKEITELITEAEAEADGGIVPAIYSDACVAAGYVAVPHSNKFIKIMKGDNNGKVRRSHR